MGAGRKVATDSVDHAVGFTRLRKVGEKVEKGAVLAVVHHNQLDVTHVVHEMTAAFVIGELQPKSNPYIVERIVE